MSSSHGDDGASPSGEASSSAHRLALTMNDLNLLAAALLITPNAARKNIFESLNIDDVDTLNKWLGLGAKLTAHGLKIKLGQVKTKLNKLAETEASPEALHPSTATPKRAAKRANDQPPDGEAPPKKAAKGQGTGAKRGRPLKGKRAQENKESGSDKDGGAQEKGAQAEKEDSEKAEASGSSGDNTSSPTDEAAEKKGAEMGNTEKDGVDGEGSNDASV